jgi:hypothetical protein
MEMKNNLEKQEIEKMLRKGQDLSALIASMG